MVRCMVLLAIYSGLAGACSARADDAIQNAKMVVPSLEPLDCLAAPFLFRPMILGIADAGCDPVAVSEFSMVPIRGDALVLKVDYVPPNHNVLVLLNGQPIACKPFCDGGCVEVALNEHAAPGVHMLSVRFTSPDQVCTLASAESVPVAIHYFCPEHYIAVDGRLPDLSTLSNNPKCICPDTRCAQCGEANCTSDCSPTGRKKAAKARKKAKLESQPEPKADEPHRKEFTFLTSAHFPLPEWTGGGEPPGSEGAVIYEGMTVSIGEHGRCRIRGLISTPPVPTTLRLRFRVKIEGDNGGHWYTITLPPMEIPPQLDNSGRPVRGVHRLQDLASEISVPAVPILNENRSKITNMQREGTARFGYGFDAMRQDSPY
jgi:hypothetical protein